MFDQNFKAMSVTAIVAGANLLGSLYSGYHSAKANRENRRSIETRESEMQGLFDQNRHGNVFNQADAQSALTRTREGLKDILKADRNNAMRTGATAESQAASKGKVAGMYTDATSQILQTGQARKDMLGGRYAQMLNNLQDTKLNFDLQDAQKWPQLMQNIAGFSGNLADVLTMPKIPGAEQGAATT